MCSQAMSFDDRCVEAGERIANQHMIARLWQGTASTSANADAYERHVTTHVFASLAAIPGYCGAQLLRREHAGRIEFLVMAFWDSIERVRAFAGNDVESAVVGPEARAVLSDYDNFVRHFEIAHTAGQPMLWPREGQ